MADFVNEETLKKWQNRVGNAPAHVQDFVNRVGGAMLIVSRKNMDQMIYAIPEDQIKSGRKKWVRSGALREAEQLEFAPDGSGVMLTNALVYARPRHELGRDGRQTKRPAHWRDPIFNQLRDAISRELAAMNAKILEGR